MSTTTGFTGSGLVECKEGKEYFRDKVKLMHEDLKELFEDVVSMTLSYVFHTNDDPQNIDGLPLERLPAIVDFEELFRASCNFNPVPKWEAKNEWTKHKVKDWIRCHRGSMIQYALQTLKKVSLSLDPHTRTSQNMTPKTLWNELFLSILSDLYSKQSRAGEKQDKPMYFLNKKAFFHKEEKEIVSTKAGYSPPPLAGYLRRELKEIAIELKLERLIPKIEEKNVLFQSMDGEIIDLCVRKGGKGLKEKFDKLSPVQKVPEIVKVKLVVRFVWVAQLGRPPFLFFVY